MNKLICGMSVVFCICTIAGCGSDAAYEGPQRFPLSGKVTLDGMPIDGGMIAFVQQSDDLRPCGATIVGGQYTIPEEKGANSGPYRIEIRWLKPTGNQRLDTEDTGEMVDIVTQVIPARYNAQSTLLASVSEQNTVFDFDLKSN